MYSIELQTVFYEYQNIFRPLMADKTGFNLKIFHFDIRGKLSIIRCDKYIFLSGGEYQNVIMHSQHKKLVGDAGYRSPYLSHAKRALYHLSYIPCVVDDFTNKKL